MRLVEQIDRRELKSDFCTRYMQYRAGRLKHQYWLWNRRSAVKKVDRYDAMIIKNCQPGRTAFFCSGGYYLKDIWPEIDSLEMHAVVTEFYPNVLLVRSRDCLKDIQHKYDNFAVVNNRGDHWVDVDGLTGHLVNYSQALNHGARLFYSFRDTQIHYNRLKIDGRSHFLSWARSLSGIGLELVWHDIQFPKKQADENGCYDPYENPDTINGNLKFWFVYKGSPWTICR